MTKIEGELPPKLSARFAISEICNLSCLYCGGSASRGPISMEDFRSMDLDQGTITTQEGIAIMRAIHKTGINRITFTGGEPLLNPNWINYVETALAIGFSRVGLTTNGTLLSSYLSKHPHLPERPFVLTVSLDTVNDHNFHQITSGGKLNLVLNGISTARKHNPELPIRINKVMLRSGLANLASELDYLKGLGVTQITLLNLIYKRPDDREFFQREYVGARDVIRCLEATGRYKFFVDEYDSNRLFSNTSEGVRVEVKDTDYTLRGPQCEKCINYCQEGYFAVRIATDGTIRACPYEKNGFVDGGNAIYNGTLNFEVGNLVQIFQHLIPTYTLADFLSHYQLTPGKDVPE